MNKQMPQVVSNHNSNNEEEEEEEDIIINDEFSDDNDTTAINPIPVSLDQAKVFGLKTDAKIVKAQSNIQHQVQEQQIDTKDVHIELPCSSQLIYQRKELSLEEEYINKIKKLSKENNELKLSNEKIQKEINEITAEIKVSNNKIEDEKKKSESYFLKQTEPLVRECQLITEKISQLENSNKRLMKQVDSYKLEYDKLQRELQLKNKTIEELTKKINQIESQLEKNIADAINNDIKDNQEESIEECNKVLSKVENQLSIAIDKMHQLTSENYKLKQALNKNRLSLAKRDNNNSNNKNKSDDGQKDDELPVRSRLCEIDTNYRNQLNSIKHSKSNSECKINQTPQSSASNEIYIKKQNTSNYNSNANKPTGPFTNQFETAMKESKILEIETILYKLQKERDKLTEELARYPEYPKHKNVINKKRNLESSINDYNCKIDKNKQKINEIKAEAYNG